MISIISPVYENKRQLRKFLDSIESAKKNIDSKWEVIIVDDSSKADIKTVIDSFPFIKYIRLPQNMGPAAARNAGANAANGEYLIFFDSDVVLKPDTLRLFEENFKSGEDVVVSEYDSAPVEKGFFPDFKAFITKSWMPQAKYISIFMLRAAGIKKIIFDAVGGFNEKIKTASVEDYEFGDRLVSKGYKIFYNPEILVMHHHPSFIKQCKLFYMRSRDLVPLLKARGWKPYELCASKSEGFSSIFGTSFIIAILLYLIFPGLFFLSVFAISFIIFTISNLSFFKIVYKEKNIFFLFVAFWVKLTLTLPITTGFFVGFLSHVIIGRSWELKT